MSLGLNASGVSRTMCEIMNKKCGIRIFPSSPQAGADRLTAVSRTGLR